MPAPGTTVAVAVGDGIKTAFAVPVVVTVPFVVSELQAGKKAIDITRPNFIRKTVRRLITAVSKSIQTYCLWNS